MLRILSKIKTSTWETAGRVLPMTALLVIGILWLVRPAVWIDYFLILVASVFGTTAFVWWWWVVAKIDELNFTIKNSEREFKLILKAIVETKTILSKRAEEVKKDHKFKK